MSPKGIGDAPEEKVLEKLKEKIGELKEKISDREIKDNCLDNDYLGYLNYYLSSCKYLNYYLSSIEDAEKREEELGDLVSEANHCSLVRKWKHNKESTILSEAEIFIPNDEEKT